MFRFTAQALVAVALLISAPSAAAPRAAHLLYVSNEGSNDISVIDTRTDRVVKTIPVGKRPRGLRVSPDGKSLFVAVSGSPRSPPGTDVSTLPPPDRAADGIAQIDLKRGEVVRILESGTDPEAFDLSPDGARIYVSNEDAALASVLDVASGRVLKRIKVGGEPEGVTTRPDGKVVYVTSEADNQVFVIDSGSHEVLATINTAPRPRTVVFTDDGKRAYVSGELGSQVTVVDAQKHTAITGIIIPGEGAKPMGLVLSGDGKTLYVSNGRGKTVSVIDVAAGKVRRTLPDVGVRPWGIALSRDGKKLYTANGPSNDVSVIDLASGKTVKRIKTGDRPWGLATPAGR